MSAEKKGTGVGDGSIKALFNRMYAMGPEVLLHAASNFYADLKSRDIKVPEGKEEKKAFLLDVLFEPEKYGVKFETRNIPGLGEVSLLREAIRGEVSRLSSPTPTVFNVAKVFKKDQL